jgi:GxxExxY protein
MEEGYTAKDAKERQGTPHEDVVARVIIKAALKIHSALGPGLLESAYEACLAHELTQAGLTIRRQVLLPIKYDGMQLDAGYRLDLLADECVVVELKAVERIMPIHTAQLLSHLRLGGFKLGMLLNFHVLHMRDGIKRIANGL